MNFLITEYPKYKPENKAWKNALFTASVVFLIFLLFQPFGFRSKATGLKLILYPGYALIAFIYSLSGFYVIRTLLKKKQTWLLKNEIISLITGVIILTVIIHLFTWIVAGDMPLTFGWYIKLLYHTASLFLLIAVIEYFYYNSRLIGDQLYAKNKAPDVMNRKSDVVAISLEKDTIEINRNKIVFIQSIGNYLEFCLRETDGSTNRISRRGRLHQVEKDLVSYSEFFRCHRAFIVNLKQSVQLRGNIKNARIVVEGEKQLIPVSRANYTNLKKKLEKIILG